MSCYITDDHCESLKLYTKFQAETRLFAVLTEFAELANQVKIAAAKESGLPFSADDVQRHFLTTENDKVILNHTYYENLCSEIRKKEKAKEQAKQKKGDRMLLHSL